MLPPLHHHRLIALGGIVRKLPASTSSGFAFASSLQKKAHEVLKGGPNNPGIDSNTKRKDASTNVIKTSSDVDSKPGGKLPVSKAKSITSDTSNAVDVTPLPSKKTDTNGMLSAPQMNLHEFAPRICVIGIGGAGGNALNNMIANRLSGVDFLALNTDAQHLNTTLTDNRIQLGTTITDGLGCGANPDVGRAAAMESTEEIMDRIGDAHMCFITAGMGGGTGTGAAPVVAEMCFKNDILTVGVVSTPFRFEGKHRMRLANEGISRLKQVVDSMIVVPNQNLYRVITEKDSLVDSLSLSNNILLDGVRSITDLMTKPGLINVDFADVCAVMHGMGNTIIGTGVASGEDRAEKATRDALHNPLLDDELNIISAKALLVNISGGKDLSLHELDKASTIITDMLDEEYANIIFGSAYDDSVDGQIRVSLVATGVDGDSAYNAIPPLNK